MRRGWSTPAAIPLHIGEPRSETVMKDLTIAWAS